MASTTWSSTRVTDSNLASSDTIVECSGARWIAPPTAHYEGKRNGKERFERFLVSGHESTKERHKGLLNFSPLKIDLINFSPSVFRLSSLGPLFIQRSMKTEGITRQITRMGAGVTPKPLQPLQMRLLRHRIMKS